MCYPVKKHECHLYDVYRSKWWVPRVSQQQSFPLMFGLVRGDRLPVCHSSLVNVTGWKHVFESCDYNSVAVHILNCHVDDWKMRTSRWNGNHLACCHCTGVSVLRKTWSSVSIPPNSLFLSPQPTITARSPWSFLRSARPCLWPRGPAMVHFNSSGETDSGESPHPSPPGQGCLHGQTLSGGRRGRCGRRWSRGSRIAAAGAWTAITGWLVCSLLVCL